MLFGKRYACTKLKTVGKRERSNRIEIHVDCYYVKYGSLRKRDVRVLIAKVRHKLVAECPSTGYLGRDSARWLADRRLFVDKDNVYSFFTLALECNTRTITPRALYPIFVPGK